MRKSTFAILGRLWELRANQETRPPVGPAKVLTSAPVMPPSPAMPALGVKVAIQELPGEGAGETLSVSGFPDDATDKTVPLVEVRIGVVPLEVVGIEHPVSAEESAVRAGSLAVVERLAVSVVEQ